MEKTKITYAYFLVCAIIILTLWIYCMELISEAIENIYNNNYKS